MHALAASCEELRARTGNPPLDNAYVLDKTWAADLCECFIVLKKWPILWVHWPSNFKNKHCLSRENQGWSLCKSGQISIRFTNID
jgi:hypothetical protein